MQRVHDDPVMLTDVVDLRDAGARDLELATEDATRLLRSEMDLCRGPLLRVHLYRLAAEDQVVAIACNRVSGDGRSLVLPRGAAMIADLVPDTVRVRQVGDPERWQESTLVAERTAVAAAVPKRRREHGHVRRLAREAMAELGVAPVPLLSGARNEPLWPTGVAGSLSHCPYCAAAVARSADVLTLGIDVELAEPLDEPLVARVCTPAEIAAMEGDSRRAKTLFSVKEAVYKAWFPIARRWLGFHDVEVTLGDDGDVVAVVLVDAPPALRRLSGRCVEREGLVASALVVPADGWRGYGRPPCGAGR